VRLLQLGEIKETDLDTDSAAARFPMAQCRARQPPNVATTTAAKQLYFDRLVIEPVQINLTLVRSRDVTDAHAVVTVDADDESAVDVERLQPSTSVSDVLFNMISMALGNVNGAPVRLDGTRQWQCTGSLRNRRC